MNIIERKASRWAAIVISCLCLAGGASAEGAPSSDPTAAALCSDGSTGGANISLADAFAHPIDDPRALRFIAYVGTLDKAKQHAARAAMRTLGVTAPSGPADLERGCTTELGYRAARALSLVANRWDVDESDPGFTLVLRRLETALSALDSDTALAPFAVRASDLTSTTQPSKKTGCDQPNTAARTLKVAQPAYPEIARLSRTAGKVNVSVELTREGFVRTARVSSSSTGDAPGARALEEASLLAAGSSTYQPEYKACEPVPGTYIFTAVFSGRP